MYMCVYVNVPYIRSVRTLLKFMYIEVSRVWEWYLYLSVLDFAPPQSLQVNDGGGGMELAFVAVRSTRRQEQRSHDSSQQG